jgi:GxGYxYP putative glycoside hydrolase C-terminal domain/GxGYxYP_N second domain/GxGYxYP third domain
MPTSTTAARAEWAAHRLLPAFDSPRSLDIYDVRNAPFDIVLSATTMSGLINRQHVRIYLLSDVDAALLQETLLVHIPTRHHSAKAEKVLDELLAKYRSSVKGLVIYDPHMIDSVNVATTLAGLRDAVVVSPQMAERLQKPPHRLPALADLRVYRWKNRLQAYRWAVRHLLKETTTGIVAGMKPTIASGLRSYLVANRAFVYWLDPNFALPDPGNGWMAERCLMKRILRSFAPGTPHLGWFIDEPRGVGLASKAALPVLPSDYFYNMEVWTAVRGSVQGLPGDKTGLAPAVSTSTEVPADRTISSKIYVSFTFSDGDNLQFNQHRMYHLWQDPARGSMPLGWTISPVLQEAAPALAEYYKRTATGRDELIAGPSGAGYIRPSQWPYKRLPAYLQLTGALMQRMGLTYVVVLDDVVTRFFPYRAWQAAYAKSLVPYGLRGILSGDAYTGSGWCVVDGVPLILNLGPTSSVTTALDLIKRNTPAQPAQPHFLSLYIDAWNMTPTDIKTVMQALDDRYEVVMPGTLSGMITRS